MTILLISFGLPTLVVLVRRAVPWWIHHQRAKRYAVGLQAYALITQASKRRIAALARAQRDYANHARERGAYLARNLGC